MSSNIADAFPMARMSSQKIFETEVMRAKKSEKIENLNQKLEQRNSLVDAQDDQIPGGALRLNREFP